MNYERYLLKYDGNHLRFAPFDSEKPPKGVLPENLQDPSPWELHSNLGDDNKLWCAVFRTPGTPGGLFVLRDFDETLLVALALSNLEFMQGLGHFARITTYTRYAADIFEHMDDDAE